MGVKEFFHKRSLRQKDDVRTNAAELTLKESIFPIFLVTILFFLWGFSYGASASSVYPIQLPRYVTGLLTLLPCQVYSTLSTSTSKRR